MFAIVYFCLRPCIDGFSVSGNLTLERLTPLSRAADLLAHTPSTDRAQWSHSDNGSVVSSLLRMRTQTPCSCTLRTAGACIHVPGKSACADPQLGARTRGCCRRVCVLQHSLCFSVVVGSLPRWCVCSCAACSRRPRRPVGSRRRRRWRPPRSIRREATPSSRVTPRCWRAAAPQAWTPSCAASS